MTDKIPERFLGDFQLESDDGFDEYLKSEGL